ncbi:hypothetical protein FISHEDRAFT_6563, partial [Fistulina hepatica ATCC 64428]
HASAKLAVMATQEHLERLAHGLHDSTDGDRPVPSQVQMCIDIYALALPRLTLRRKSISETIQPLLSEISALLGLISNDCNRSDGREILCHISQLARAALKWCTDAGTHPKEIGTVKNILKTCLDSTLVSLAHCICAALSSRTFKTCFPRLGSVTSPEEGWQEGEGAMNELLETYSLLDITTEKFADRTSIAGMIMLAHAPSERLSLSTLIPLLLPFLQTACSQNFAVDEALALTMKTLTRASTSPGCTLTEEHLFSLVTQLATLSSAHQNANVRFQAYRTLALLLNMAPSPIRFQIVRELIADTTLPPMQVAAVALLKEALAATNPPDIFWSPAFMQTFGPLLFRPISLSAAANSIVDFTSSYEGKYVIEVLNLYYVLLLRDASNKTGLRDKDNMKNVDRVMLAPLRAQMTRWI